MLGWRGLSAFGHLVIGIETSALLNALNRVTVAYSVAFVHYIEARNKIGTWSFVCHRAYMAPSSRSLPWLWDLNYKNPPIRNCVFDFLLLQSPKFESCKKRRVKVKTLWIIRRELAVLRESVLIASNWSHFDNTVNLCIDFQSMFFHF